MTLLFWFCVFILFYTFVGYGLLLYFLVIIKRKFFNKVAHENDLISLPTATLVVAAYNEEDVIREKIVNSLQLNYPANKLSFIFVTDGSTDNSMKIIGEYNRIRLFHSPERKGKINAIHRVMKEVSSDIVIFTDANTTLNDDALVNIARHYSDKNVGAVAGEKTVLVDKSSDATAGEGFYWRYESKLKQWDSELYTVVGAAGELFSVRTDLYEDVPKDTILDDFMISMKIALKGYRIVYDPEALAYESSSANVKEELKRKVRILAGGIQSIVRLKSAFNIFKYPVLSFQFISHRVLRWTVTPFLMIFAFILNIVIVEKQGSFLYSLLLFLQTGFYVASILGWILNSVQIKVKLLFVPFYFCFMNYAVIMGIIRYFKGSQKAAWEKVKRK